jgi:hypothetical protein
MPASTAAALQKHGANVGNLFTHRNYQNNILVVILIYNY